MTIQTLMDRIAGSDYEWDQVDPSLLNMGGEEVQVGMLTGIDSRDGRTFMFRLPLEHLKKKP